MLLWHIHWAKLTSSRWALQTSLLFFVIQHLASSALTYTSIFASLNRGHWQQHESHFRSGPADVWKDFLVLLHQQRCATRASAAKCKLQPFLETGKTQTLSRKHLRNYQNGPELRPIKHSQDVTESWIETTHHPTTHPGNPQRSLANVHTCCFSSFRNRLI